MTVLLIEEYFVKNGPLALAAFEMTRSKTLMQETGPPRPQLALAFRPSGKAKVPPTGLDPEGRKVFATGSLRDRG